VSVTLDQIPSVSGRDLAYRHLELRFPLGPDSVTYEPLPDPTGKRILLDPKVAEQTSSPKSTLLTRRLQTGAHPGCGSSHGRERMAYPESSGVSGHPLLIPARSQP